MRVHLALKRQLAVPLEAEALVENCACNRIAAQRSQQELGGADRRSEWSCLRCSSRMLPCSANLRYAPWSVGSLSAFAVHLEAADHIPWTPRLLTRFIAVALHLPSRYNHCWCYVLAAQQNPTVQFTCPIFLSPMLVAARTWCLIGRASHSFLSLHAMHAYVAKAGHAASFGTFSCP